MSEIVQDGAGNFFSVFSTKTERISDEEESTEIPVYNTDIPLSEPQDTQTSTKNNRKKQNKSSICYNNTEFNINFDCGTTLLNLDTQNSFETPYYESNESPEARIWSNCEQRRLLQEKLSLEAQSSGEKASSRIWPNCQQRKLVQGKLISDAQSSVEKISHKSKESPEARERRLRRNAERMREKRAKETPEERRARLKKSAESRMRRPKETEAQRSVRAMKNSERQRLKRANETPEEREKRLKKGAERMRRIRAQMPKVVKPNLADRLIGF